MSETSINIIINKFESLLLILKILLLSYKLIFFGRSVVNVHNHISLNIAVLSCAKLFQKQLRKCLFFLVYILCRILDICCHCLFSFFSLACNAFFSLNNTISNGNKPLLQCLLPSYLNRPLQLTVHCDLCNLVTLTWAHAGLLAADVVLGGYFLYP